MSSGQRLVKYLAIAFAIFLAVSILSGIVSVALALVNIIPGGTTRVSSWSKNDSDYSKSFDHVTSLNIDHSWGDLRIMTGETFKVEAQDVSKNFEAKVDHDGTLKIAYNNGGIHFPGFRLDGFGNSKSKVTIYLPEDFIAERAEIDAGAGNITIDGLATDRLEISAGAGNLSGSDIVAQKVDIDGGVGNINLDEVHFTNAVLESGVGNLKLNGTLLGNTKVDCGVGEVELNLTGDSDDYRFQIDSGIGKVKLNGEKISGEYNSGSDAPNLLDVEGGIGSVNINFD